MQIKVIFTCLKKKPTEYVIEYEVKQGCYKRINYKTTKTLLNSDSLTLGYMHKNCISNN